MSIAPVGSAPARAALTSSLRAAIARRSIGPAARGGSPVCARSAVTRAASDVAAALSAPLLARIAAIARLASRSTWGKQSPHQGPCSKNPTPRPHRTQSATSGDRVVESQPESILVRVHLLPMAVTVCSGSCPGKGQREALHRIVGAHPRSEPQRGFLDGRDVCATPTTASRMFMTSKADDSGKAWPSSIRTRSSGAWKGLKVGCWTLCTPYFVFLGAAGQRRRQPHGSAIVQIFDPDDCVQRGPLGVL